MRSPRRSVVIHGHFYQPPREDPWTGRVEAQPSAAPQHDWNARVEQECYRAVVAARIPGEGGRIGKIVNTLRAISFNFGPTLLAWMEKEAPRTYESILEADALSRDVNGGHGNAIAQAYHHAILPLATRRDKVTEVRWGMEDFRRRFRRDPVGMWLPETAVDGETLDVLAQEGIAFTILAPHQVNPVPAHGLPGLYRTPGGREIALFVYDGPLSHDVAFGPLLKNAARWADRMTDPKTDDALVCLATDGETYGHHHRFGEMALAAILEALANRRGIRVENFASFLTRHPPEEVVELVEPTSWSCSHGVERWRSDCGCKMDPERNTQQEWRSGLRKAMEWLAEEINQLVNAESPLFIEDVWRIRDRYGRVVAGSEREDDFLDSVLLSPGDPPSRTRARRVLELEVNALRLFTSCGWFFDDLAGIEPLQVLRYGARALELMGERGQAARNGFLAHLATAQSNESPPRSGDEVFLDEEETRHLLSSWFPEGEAGGSGGDSRALPHRLSTALTEAVRGLAPEEEAEPDAVDEHLFQEIRRVRELAFVHTMRRLPIPFDVQTDFFRLLGRSSGSRLQALSALRAPLGFVAD